MSNNKAMPSIEKMIPSMDTLFTPWRESSLLTLEYSQKMLDVRFKAIDSAVKAGIAQARTWCEVNDAESLRNASQAQQETLSAIGETLRVEGEELFTLSKEYQEKCQTVARQALDVPKNES
ncbi:hypothetical protein [Halomonas denitrificans]|uniref:hypothetical protein n=1 Tax=Halomonas denitrificans TaxID=370769 RepID=UPI001C9940F3|nr:hypothetical protein [Halomonas denitrificans]MBY5967401.1 hypothetical protein [Halomonas denitrificans]